MRDALKTFVRTSPLARPLRLARFNLIARRGGHEDWAALMGDELPAFRQAIADAAVAAAPSTEDRAERPVRVLIATGIGGHFALNAIDRLLAVALTLRGAAVTIGLCDRALDACQMCESNLFPRQQRFLDRGPDPDLCNWCYAPSAEAHKRIGLPVDRYGAYLTADLAREADETARTLMLDGLEAFTWEGIPVGEHARAGALRFFASGDMAREPDAEAVQRRYLVASLKTAMAMRGMIAAQRPDVVVTHHGIYVPQGIVAAAARAAGARVVAWNPAYRKHCFLFSHGDTYHHTMMDEPVGIWADRPLTEAQDTTIRSYLDSRWQGAEDWISFHKTPDFGLTRDIAALGMDPAKPLILALTNVFWDAQLHYPANAFPSQRAWLLRTIAWFADHPELQLVIRVHPAELTGSPASRQLAADVIAEAYPTLPANVRVVPPESAISTYDLARLCDSAIIYGTKTGVELTSVGKPVIVAGEAWIRNKGLTHDAQSVDGYEALLARLPFGAPLPADVVERARRYAYHFFFRRMLLLPFVAADGGPRRFAMAIDGLKDLRPGASVGLDVICDGILTGSPFYMPE